MAQTDATKSANAIIKSINAVDFNPEALAIAFDYKASNSVSAAMFHTMVALCRQWASHLAMNDIDETDPFFNQAVYAQRILDALPGFDTAIASATSNQNGRHL